MQTEQCLLQSPLSLGSRILSVVPVCEMLLWYVSNCLSSRPDALARVIGGQKIFRWTEEDKAGAFLFQHAESLGLIMSQERVETAVLPEDEVFLG